MNGWILKVLHPNIYGNHDWMFQNIGYETVTYGETTAPYVRTIYIRVRSYICLQCNQSLRMYCSFPRLIFPDDPRIQDCNEAKMIKALE